MNKKLKYIGLFAILPLFTISLTAAGQIDTVAATNVGTIGGTGGHNIGNTNLVGSSSVDDGPSGSHKFGSMTAHIVCGDRLCSESTRTFEAKAVDDARVDLTGPYFDLVDIQKSSANSENTYKAIFDVWAGDQNITDLKMLIKSDSETLETMAGSFNAGDHSITMVRIMATDPDSISGEIIDFKVSSGSDKAVSAKQVSGLTGSITPEAKSLDGSYFELYDMTSLGSGLYKVTLVMHTGSENSQNDLGGALPELGRVLHASSDNANELVYVPRIPANSQDWLSVIISADDPSTIKIQ